MIAVDWIALALGGVAGVFMSIVFFAGLAFGMQRALQADYVIKTLALSAVIRIAAFLGIGWLVVMQAGPWAFAGYGAAFFTCRRIVILCAGITAPSGLAK
ncbi:MAG: ATP synthase subunit AtpR [Roseovarius sp.]|nr:ATP synthase subunit AtpR [Roseovarius sp.]